MIKLNNIINFPLYDIITCSKCQSSNIKVTVIKFGNAEQLCIIRMHCNNCNYEFII